MTRLHEQFFQRPDGAGGEGDNVCDANPPGRPRQDGTARRRAGAASTAARSPASSIRITAARRRRRTMRTWDGVDVAIDFSTPDAVVGERAGARRRAASTSSSARPGGARTKRRCGRRSATPASASSPRRISRPASCSSKRSSRTRPSCSRARHEFGAFVHEAHHSAKKDAPSGTALLLKRAMEQRRLRAADRRVVDARRVHSRHAHGRLRRSGRNDHADARRARSHGVRARRADRGAVGHTAGAAGSR